MSFHIAIINGPNLNLLGEREPDIYGNQNFDSYLVELKQRFPEIHFHFFQSNIEGEIVVQIQNIISQAQGLIINPAAFTHTSVAIRDALALLNIPIAEVHLSKISQREGFRNTSMTKDYCFTFIEGYGLKSYEIAVSRIVEYLNCTNS